MINLEESFKILDKFYNQDKDKYQNALDDVKKMYGIFYSALQEVVLDLKESEGVERENFDLDTIIGKYLAFAEFEQQKLTECLEELRISDPILFKQIEESK